MIVQTVEEILEKKTITESGMTWKDMFLRYGRSLVEYAKTLELNNKALEKEHKKQTKKIKELEKQKKGKFFADEKNKPSPAQCVGKFKNGKPCTRKPITENRCKSCFDKHLKSRNRAGNNSRNFGVKGWTLFLPESVKQKAQQVLDSPDWFNMIQEVEYKNTHIADIAEQLASLEGNPQEKWVDFKNEFAELKRAYFENESLYENFAKIDSLIKFCSEEYMLRKSLDIAINQKGNLIRLQQTIQEKEQMFVSIDKLLMFGVALYSAIESVLPIDDKQISSHDARKELRRVMQQKFQLSPYNTEQLESLPEENIIEVDYIDEDDYIAEDE